MSLPLNFMSCEDASLSLLVQKNKHNTCRCIFSAGKRTGFSKIHNKGGVFHYFLACNQCKYQELQYTMFKLSNQYDGTCVLADILLRIFCSIDIPFQFLPRIMISIIILFIFFSKLQLEVLLTLVIFSLNILSFYCHLQRTANLAEI